VTHADIVCLVHKTESQSDDATIVLGFGRPRLDGLNKERDNITGTNWSRESNFVVQPDAITAKELGIFGSKPF
jgi:hypothetical protein